MAKFLAPPVSSGELTMCGCVSANACNVRKLYYKGIMLVTKIIILKLYCTFYHD